MIMKANVIYKDGGRTEAAVYDGRLSPFYAMILFVCSRKGFNHFNIQKQEEAKKFITVKDSNVCEYKEDDNNCFFISCGGRKNVYEGKEGDTCDFVPEIK